MQPGKKKKRTAAWKGAKPARKKVKKTVEKARSRSPSCTVQDFHTGKELSNEEIRDRLAAKIAETKAKEKSDKAAQQRKEEKGNEEGRSNFKRTGVLR